MNIAFIPVRGGSKSIPLKNIKEIAGKPLVYWTVKAAEECSYIDKIYVATDSDIITEVVEGFNLSKVTVIGRSAESASDTASTEFAMLEFAEKYEFDNIVLIQATSPLLSYDDLNGGFELFNSEGTDSVLSVVRQKRFNWTVDENGNAHPTNYDVFARPRRQEFDGYLVENGAFYITSRRDLLNSKNRISGSIKAYEMCEETYFEIDEPSDWVVIEHQLSKKISGKSQQNKTISGRKIKMFLTDCDGCLTDGGMYYSENGDELKKFNTKDGMAFSLLRDKGIITGIITGEDMKLNRRRAEKLKINEIHSGVKDKVAIIKELCEKYDILPEEVAYVGDDINDISAIEFVGLGCTVLDACDDAKKVADIVIQKVGGDGAIRAIVDAILGE